VSEGVPSFGAMPRGAWTVLGVVELVCSVGLVAPGALHWEPGVTVVAAGVLAVESLVFVWVHLKYKEATPIVMSAVLGLVMAFLVYGRIVLRPLWRRRTLEPLRLPMGSKYWVCYCARQ